VFGKVDTGAINLTNLGNRSKYAIDYLGGEANNSFFVGIIYCNNFHLNIFSLFSSE
jgi:hypothetical protein